MAGFHANDTMPKIGLVTDLREQWLVRTDGALAHRLQDREISSHLCENRYRNQQIREDFPVALSEQRGIEHEVRLKELARRRQADIDAEIAREMAEINLRRQRRQHSDIMQQPSSSRDPPPVPPTDIDPEELGLSSSELEEMRRRLEQEEKDARLARELSHETCNEDVLLADMRCAVEAQDSELARLLQEREYKKLQRAKEKAKQKALLKKQQRLSQQQEIPPDTAQATLCDAYSNPRDVIQENRLRLCKSVDSDLNYVEPFEKEVIQSKASALLAKEISNQYYKQDAGSSFNATSSHIHPPPLTTDKSLSGTASSIQHRQPPPPPIAGKKPRFPDPVSIRPASHYPTDNVLSGNDMEHNVLPKSHSENSHFYDTTFTSQNDSVQQLGYERGDSAKRLSVISDITAEGLEKKKRKQAKKSKGCRIQ
ncbi:mediator of RNA polymerase II transcription subunit 12 [Papilio machaon]|uniref:mediator of RNA polymerase II transcription subunit 12 n=1 Tax=Papilio machaon TaxID=76193 RepID=UPI001E662AF5|nr:mediator of RNA polymerase II transcription subunit 12 [Papilio machaon]